ncbi:cytochrome P450 72A15-like [Asparagus officinalis]|uniref:cytochrome P450 72A15-like n=1 Tax=Asparagus officinalis TaxID=4686 RepID=UPI00098E2C53|nr:cytochrome P450 72A15-like [Asparagus officinalis]
MVDLYLVTSMISSLLLSCLILRGAYSLWWRPKMMEKMMRSQGLMGRPYKFLLGDVKEFGQSIIDARSKPMELHHRIIPRTLPFAFQLIQSLGNMCFYWVFTSPKIIIRDPELIKEVLTNKCGQFRQLPLAPSLRLTGGVSLLDGDEWAQHRSIINPAFHQNKLKEMVPEFCTSCSDMIERWRNLVSHRGSVELDVWIELKNMTADVISRTAFGSSYNEGRRIFELQEEQLELVMLAHKLPHIPGFRFIPTKNNLRRYWVNKEIKIMLRDLIQKKEQAMKQGKCDYKDLLGLMLSSNKQAHRDMKGLTIDEVMEECKLFYFAGHETTSVLLTWTMVLLSMYPLWQSRAREEVREICGREMPSYESIGQLKIVNMILHEALRLYPPVPAQYRYLYSQTKLGGFSLPGGTDLILPTIFIHHDPEIWGEDAEEFKPERFSDGVLKATNHQFAFFPFGWGPKTCIGQNFALIEARIALAMILRHFFFELSPSYVHSPFSFITVQPQHGAPLILHQL